MSPEPNSRRDYAGLEVELVGAGRVRLTYPVAQNSETAIYHTTTPDIAVKLFDLNCAKSDEISYGPYMGFGVEVANFQDIQVIEDLRSLVPTYYGAHVDYEKKYAYIAMEYLQGVNLKQWCEQSVGENYPGDWLADFKQIVFQSMAIMTRFHQHGILLLDFKPENIIRLSEGGIRFVDLGGFFTPRHYNATDKYVYSATPDYAELLIDAPNVQAGVPPTEASDIFSAGVALFEMATGSSRLEIDAGTAQEILHEPSIFRFRDSQIRDLWKSYPHLKDLLPSVETQLKEGRVLFSELWHLLKGYVASKVADWDQLSSEQHDGIILATGTTFVLEQLPEHFQWLAGPISQSTVLRSIRLKRIADLMKLVESPIDPGIADDLRHHNLFCQYLCDLRSDIDPAAQMNTWDVCCNEQSGHWGIGAPAAFMQITESASFIFLKRRFTSPEGHRFYDMVGELEADTDFNGPVTLFHFRNDHFAWLQ